jgi:hypothetical protein
MYMARQHRIPPRDHQHIAPKHHRKFGDMPFFAEWFAKYDSWHEANARGVSFEDWQRAWHEPARFYVDGGQS